jgi:hypothetical protein
VERARKDAFELMLTTPPNWARMARRGEYANEAAAGVTEVLRMAPR